MLVSDKTYNNRILPNYNSNSSEMSPHHYQVCNHHHQSSGVLQVSVLGPSIFCYVNDIGRNLEFSKIRLFADDAFLNAPVNSHYSDVHCFQKDLDVLEKWAEQWNGRWHRPAYGAGYW